MKRKFRSKLILFLLAIMTLFIFGGCTLGTSIEDYEANLGWAAKVCYYANGGEFENKKAKKELRYAEGVIALDLGNVALTSGSVGIKRDKHEFAGWYHIQQVDGVLVFEDEQAGTYKLGEKVDFTKPLEKGTEWHIAAKWTTASKVLVQLVADEGATLVDSKDATKSYVNGNVIREISYGSTGKAVKPTGDPVSAKDGALTFIDYYQDAACTVSVNWKNFVKQDADVTIYAKYITGKWNIVKDGIGLSQMFSNVDATQKYWIVNDIDYKNGSLSVLSTLNFEIQGNGHKISNVKFNKGQIASGAKVAIFGAVTQTAKIENLTLENVEISYGTKTSEAAFDAYIVFSALDAGASVNNVSVKGNLRMTIDGPSGYSISNNLSSNCLYGGFAADADYVVSSANTGFKVETTPTIIRMENGSPIN